MKIVFLCLVLCAAQASFASLPNLSGKDLMSEKNLTINWKDQKKGTVLVFLSSVCPCSDAHVEHLAKLSTDHPDLSFIGIHSNANEDAEKSRKYFQDKKLPFAIIQDKKSFWADRLKAYRTPHAFLVTPQGEIAYQGGVTSSADPKRADSFYLKTTLQKFLKGERIDSARSRVLGCEIARH